MTVTERTLKKWRQEALMFELKKDSFPEDLRKTFEEGSSRILRMTQILLDQHLLRKAK